MIQTLQWYRILASSRPGQPIDLPELVNMTNSSAVTFQKRIQVIDYCLSEVGHPGRLEGTNIHSYACYHHLLQRA